VSDRIVCWFSCGAASAVATKLAIEENARKLPLVVARVWVAEEHPDNDRFAADCERWFGVPITNLVREEYGGSIYQVFEQTRYISGIQGAACTRRLKKEVREAFQINADLLGAGDLQVFGYTAEEQDRVDDFIDANADARIWPILVERKLTHANCLALVQRAGIRLPTMYALNYHHNNCIGCVKGGAGYWNKIRVDFPPVFDRMAKLSRSLNVRLVKAKGQRVFLDELPPDAGDYPNEPEIQCGPFCEMAEKDIAQGCAA